MTVTCTGGSVTADPVVLRAAYPLLAKAPTVFDCVILAESSASDLDVMVTMPVKGGRYAFNSLSLSHWLYYFHCFLNSLASQLCQSHFSRFTQFSLFRYGALSFEDNASAARLLERLGVRGVGFDSPPSSQETLDDRWINSGSNESANCPNILDYQDIRSNIAFHWTETLVDKELYLTIYPEQ